MLTLKEIKKDYQAGDNVVHALRGVSLEFRANEFVSILGASGCGKTTLLNIIGGLDRYTDGELLIGGVSTKNYTDKDWDVYRNHRVGFVFQTYNLIPHQTVLGNVELALTLSGVSKTERRRRAEETLEKVGLRTELNKLPNQLSGGQMQRVAIARALVNDPEILLADEPTGALDTETSVQIMELIREIAGDRLVVMVTHNPELAERYSTRIVRLSDGLVVSDTAPCDGAEQTGGAASPRAETVTKTAMSYQTAMELSGRNLIAKKKRTTITGIAGSIGIIGVSLVLALRGGFGTYMSGMEKDMLSRYPLTISQNSLDYASILQAMEGGDADVDISRLDDSVYVNALLTKLAGNVMSKNNFSQEYLEYLDGLDEDHYHAKRVEYGGDVGNNLFHNVSFTAADENGNEKEHSYMMSLNGIVNMFEQSFTENTTVGSYEIVTQVYEFLMNSFFEIPSNRDYVLSQYDLVAGTYPEETSENEFLLVLNNDGGMTDLMLAQLGLLSMDEVLELFQKDPLEAETVSYLSYEQILANEYLYYPNDAIYTYAALPSLGSLDSVWQRTAWYSPSGISIQQSRGTKMKISGILRPKSTTEYGALYSGLGYMSGFSAKYVADCRASRIVTATDQAQKETQEVWSVEFVDLLKSLTADKIDPTCKQVQRRDLGGLAQPYKISYFIKDFEHKDAVTAYLDRWNEEIKSGDQSAQVQYSDTVAVLMIFIRNVLDATTYTLVAFTAISLVVSSMMIGIITYVSVVERTKEIGVLRSLGARKKDIRRLFNAETFLIGLAAGVFGVLTAYVLSLPVNLILYALTAIPNLATLPLWQALVMVAVSVILTLVGGWIPANAAANKDPVIALRTE